jgi:hypothetical protein
MAHIGAQQVQCTAVYLTSLMDLNDVLFIISSYAKSAGLSYESIGYKIRNTVFASFTSSLNEGALASNISALCNVSLGNVAVNTFNTTYIVYVTGEGIDANCVNSYGRGIQILELDFNIPSGTTAGCAYLKSQLNTTMYTLVSPSSIYSLGITSPAALFNRGYTVLGQSGVLISDAPAVSVGTTLPVVTTILVALVLAGVVATTVLSWQRAQRRDLANIKTG